MTNLTLDLETTGLDPFVDKIVLVAFRFTGCPEPYTGTLADATANTRLRCALADPKVTMRGHNIKFDALFLHANGFEVNCQLDDTRVMAYLNWPNIKHDLKNLVERKLLRPVVRLEDITVYPSKKEMHKYTQNSDYAFVGGGYAPLDKLTEYAAADVVNCDDLKRCMNVTAWWRDTEMPMTKVLFDMEKRGLMIDRTRMGELETEFTDRKADLEAYFGELNPGSTKQLAAKLTADGVDLSVCDKTEKGSPKLDKLFFKKLAWQGNEFAGKVLDYRKTSKLLGTYISPLLTSSELDGRVHGSFNQAGVEDLWGDGTGGTSTGRLTSSNPNLQNIPARGSDGKRIRACFIPSKDHFMVNADLKQIEPRLVAHYSQSPKLIHCYQNGIDTHGMFGSEIFKVPIEKLTKTQRFIGKSSWLATVYGCSYKKLLAICETNSDDPLDLDLEPYIGLWDRLTAADHKRLLRFNPTANAEVYAKWMFFKNVQDQFISSNPELITWRNGHIARSKITNAVVTFGGRRIPVDNLCSGDRRLRAQAERHCVNYLIQGSAADIFKMVMVRAQKEIVNTGKGHLLATIHDELLCEFPSTENKDLSLSLVNAIMCSTVKLRNVPIESDSKIVSSWGDGK